MIHIDVESGWIREARRVPSPNFDERPVDCCPELMIVHGISLPPGEFGGEWIDRLFTNSVDPDAHPYFCEIVDLRVSSHLLIRRDGELVQYVSLAKRAWHAGVSCYREREKCNDYSIGIELEGTDNMPYTDVQYDVLVSVVKSLRSVIPSLVGAPVVGHCDVAAGRKTDPGPAFDWERLNAQLTTAGVSG
jgi:AmpD protein